MDDNVKVDWIEEIKAMMEKLVSELPTEGFQLDAEEAGKILSKIKNWSALGSDGITKVWWKKARVLHEGVTKSFEATVHQPEIPSWFTGGKTNLRLSKYCSSRC